MTLELSFHTHRRMKGVSDLSERPGFFRPIVDASPAGIMRPQILTGNLSCLLLSLPMRRQPSACEHNSVERQVVLA